MRLHEQDIVEFIQIYEKVFGKRLAIEDARVLATKLIHLYELITEPVVKKRDLEKPIIK